MVTWSSPFFFLSPRQSLLCVESSFLCEEGEGHTPNLTTMCTCRPALKRYGLSQWTGSSCFSRSRATNHSERLNPYTPSPQSLPETWQRGFHGNESPSKFFSLRWELELNFFFFFSFLVVFFFRITLGKCYVGIRM